MGGTTSALPRGCADPIDTVVLRTGRVAIGRFRCPADHPRFRDSGPISDCLVVFPRTSVRIQHAGSPAFVADPGIITIYNRAQRYERFRMSPDGDRSDWFAVADDLAREIAATFDAGAASSERPFRFQWTTGTASLYLRQRLLLHRALAGRADALEVEEGVMSIVAAVLGSAHGAAANSGRTSAAHRELAEATRTVLSRTMRVNHSVLDIAREVGASPYHLCRVFRACLGVTMHQYRMELRLRAALELLDSGQSARHGLSALALDLGFASHAHLVRAVRHHLGVTPSALRGLLSG